jgi:hypothetical protein
MKEIKAFEATDGEKFFTEAECLVHEKLQEFEAWYSENTTNFLTMAEVLHWLAVNAEDIRGFLPPVETKPELDIEVLRDRSYFPHNGKEVVTFVDLEKWLAGDLK